MVRLVGEGGDDVDAAGHTCVNVCCCCVLLYSPSVSPFFARFVEGDGVRMADLFLFLILCKKGDEAEDGLGLLLLVECFMSGRI